MILSQRLLNTHSGLGPIVARVPLGIIFMAHGAQKLFGWFGGAGFEATAGWFDSIGLQPGALMAALAGGTEFFGGLALLVGFLTRPASLLLSITMIVAIFTVHIGNGLFMANNGYEFALALLSGTAALLISGSGRFGVDHYLVTLSNHAVVSNSSSSRVDRRTHRL